MSGRGENGSVDLQGDSVIGAVRIFPMRRRHLRSVMRIEEDLYPRPWSVSIFLAELTQRSSRRYTVATIGPMVVGYAGLMMVGDEGHVTTLSVDEPWQNKSIGKYLLLDLARAAIRMGAKELTLEVRVGNEPAQAVYRLYGFAPVGLRRNYYEETGEDALIMTASGVDTDEYARRLSGIEKRLVPTTR